MTYELSLCLGLVADGVPDDARVDEGEGRDEPLGQAGGEGVGVRWGDWSWGGETRQETQDKASPHPHHGYGQTGDIFS